MNDYTNNMFLRIETAMTLLRMELEQVNLKLTDMERSITRFETNSANTMNRPASYASMVSLNPSASSADITLSLPTQSMPTESHLALMSEWTDVEQVEPYMEILLNYVLDRHKDEMRRVSKGASAFLCKDTHGVIIAALIYRYRAGCGNEILRHIATSHVVFHEHVILKYVELLTSTTQNFYTETHTSVAEALICRGVTHIVDVNHISRVLPHIRKTVNARNTPSNLIITNEHDYRRTFKPYSETEKAPLYSYIIPPGNRIRLLLGNPQ
ncbi:hypothetical protein EhV145_00152 [Emiliania huxleyi virus 145]|nr:hypothetical protein EOVG_00123 [Emiliania huxleyi virus 88]AHA54703.1 hypothetical protein EhV145_00152 [Emiliania huxleyi virus 145]AHA55731.1 hypothetical protein EhV164_00141 [Emiliania huxleyi virus 164]